MTLLELLVEKGRKNTWGWAKAARWAKGRKDVVAWRIIDEADVDFIANSSGEKVTKEQYEEALAATKEQKMKYEYLKGSEKDFEGAPEWAAIKTKIDAGEFWLEKRDLGYRCKIVGSSVSFEISSIPQVDKVIAERRPITEPSWDGVGLPTVGYECEFNAEDGSWGSGTVLFVGEKRIFWRCHEDNMEYNCEISPPEFRPIRSEADKKRHKAASSIQELFDSYGDDAGNEELSRFGERLIEKIAAGKIPGVKLED